MAIISLQCNSLSQIHSSACFKLKIVSTGRGWMGEVLIQVWLKSIKKWVSYWRTKWMHKKRIWKNISGAHVSSRKPTKKCAHKKVCDILLENETKKKRLARKNIIDGRRAFIRYAQKTRAMDINQLQIDDCWYNEGTICLVNGWMSAKGMVFRTWVHERAPLNLQWLVLRIGGADFLHSWVANSIWLERAKLLITKQ